jgi:hypothetical protein
MFSKKIVGWILAIVLVVGQVAVVSAVEERQAHSYFGTFTGIVQEIQPHGSDENMELVLLENEEGAIANLVITETTYFIGEDQIGVGQKVTGYYVADAPMLMIYPPQYPAKVVIIGDQDSQMKIDRFNDEFVSDDNMLKLNDLSETEIVDEQGVPFTKILSGRQLIVFYDASTKSIPAQTNPRKIIVLNREKAINEMEIVVQGSVIDGPPAFETEEGLIMVPIRAIAEALDYEVQWHNDTRKVSIGDFSEFQIGVNQYTFAKMMPIELASEPVIVNDRSFVPLSYFTEVLQIQEAYVGEYEIIINDPAVLYE